jgi:hypothetical protein
VLTATDRSRSRVAAVLIAVLAALGAQLCGDVLSAEAVVFHSGHLTVVPDHGGTPSVDEHDGPGNDDDHSCGPTGIDVPAVQPAPIPGSDLVVELVEPRSAQVDLPRAAGGDPVRALSGSPSLASICVSRR